MIDQLKDKRVIFFDVGYTLDRPASGDWMFTNRFLQEAGETVSGNRGTVCRRAEQGRHIRQTACASWRRITGL